AGCLVGDPGDLDVGGNGVPRGSCADRHPHKQNLARCLRKGNGSGSGRAASGLVSSITRLDGCVGGYDTKRRPSRIFHLVGHVIVKREIVKREREKLQKVWDSWWNVLRRIEIRQELHIGIGRPEDRKTRG